MAWQLRGERGVVMLAEGARFATLVDAQAQMASLIATQTGAHGRRVEFDEGWCVLVYNHTSRLVDRLWIENDAGHREPLDL